jgi:dihydrofolate reductase
MRKLIVKISMSLGGFVSGANSENDWIFKTGDSESLAWSVGKAREAGLIIMGRKSFEAMAPFGRTGLLPRR